MAKSHKGGQLSREAFENVTPVRGVISDGEWGGGQIRM